MDTQSKQTEPLKDTCQCVWSASLPWQLLFALFVSSWDAEAGVKGERGEYVWWESAATTEEWCKTRGRWHCTCLRNDATNHHSDTCLNAQTPREQVEIDHVAERDSCRVSAVNRACAGEGTRRTPGASSFFSRDRSSRYFIYAAVCGKNLHQNRTCVCVHRCTPSPRK